MEIDVKVEKEITSLKRQKVFLLNTHLYGLMNEAELHIQRLCIILDIFEDKKDVILLWRPHPLSLETIYSLNYQIENKYQQILRRFANMDNGIYDNTPNINQAFQTSDAYIGDCTSSLTSLYGYTQKPIYPLTTIQKIEFVQTIAGVQIEKYFYFSGYNINGFFRYDFLTKEILFLKTFSKETSVAVGIHRCAVAYEKDCWFIPQGGNYISKINVETLEISYLEIPEECQIMNTLFKFYTAIKQGKYAWVIPAYAASVLRIDLEEEIVQCFSCWPDSFKWDFKRHNFAGATLRGKEIWLNPYEAQCIVKIDTDTGTMSAYSWEYPVASFSSIEFDGEWMWFTPYNYHKVLKWNPISNEKVELDFLELELKHGKYFYDSYFYNGYVWMIPGASEYILKIKTDSNELTKLASYPQELLIIKNNANQSSFCDVIKLSQKKILITSPRTNGELVLDTETDDMFYLSLDLSDLQKRLLQNAELELFKDCLQDFVRDVCEDNVKEDKTINILNDDKQYFNCGRNVWKMIKERKL